MRHKSKDVIKAVKELSEAKQKEEEQQQIRTQEELSQLTQPISIVQNSNHNLPHNAEIEVEEQRRKEAEHIKEHARHQDQTEYYDVNKDGIVIYKHLNKHFFSRELIDAFLVTQYFIIFYRPKNQKNPVFIHAPISDCTAEVENSYSMGMFTGNRYRHNFSGMSMNFPIGTLIIYQGNTPIITLYGINDPHGIKRLILTQKKLNR
jgi:hypothetical protein